MNTGRFKEAAACPNIEQKHWAPPTRESGLQADSYQSKSKSRDLNPSFWSRGKRASSALPQLLRKCHVNDIEPRDQSVPGCAPAWGTFYTLDRRITGAGSVGPFDPNVVSLAWIGTNMEVDAKFDVPSRFSTGGRHVVWEVPINGLSTVSDPAVAQLVPDFLQQADADTLYPPKLGLASATLAECAVRPVPFLSMILGFPHCQSQGHRHQGIGQADPVVDFFSSNGEPRFTDAYPGNDTLINTPWDFSYGGTRVGGDDMLPNVDNTTNSSYIVTGVRKADGVSRIVAPQLPTRPLASLADLTHMQIRALNPTPPYSGNIIANSDASPLIPKGQHRQPCQHTRQCPQQRTAGRFLLRQPRLIRRLVLFLHRPQTLRFRPFGRNRPAPDLSGFPHRQGASVNRAYRPIPEDRVSDDTAAAGKFTEHVEPTESWKTIASRLEVEGMFNVNSTSVRAWRALLGHARNQKIPYAQPGGTIGLSGQTDYAFSRTSVAGDRAAGDPPQVAGEYADTTEFTGYRVFTDDMLDQACRKHRRAGARTRPLPFPLRVCQPAALH
jgi:hypothetical protein